MSVDEIHWHDCSIRKVVELPEREQILFEVDYPVDWDNGVYEPHTISFDDVYTYDIQEGAIRGAPTILGATASDTNQEGVISVRIETNAGYRVVQCRAVSIERGEIPG